jgi:hypothetical protein
MPVVQGASPPSDFGLPLRRGSPGLGRVTLCLPEPSQPEGDGLESDRTYPLSLSDADTAQVANLPGYPNPVQPVGLRGRQRERIAPIMGRSSTP